MMRFTKPQKPVNQQLVLQRQIQTIRNEMEFIEILVQFWPWGNMASKLERLERRLHSLSQQCQVYSLPQAV